MIREQFAENIKETLEDCYAICIEKNKDYCPEDNPFATFEGIIDPEDAILYEIHKKLQRLKNLRGQEATFESADDTIMDMINYLAILRAYRSK